MQLIDCSTTPGHLVYYIIDNKGIRGKNVPQYIVSLSLFKWWRRSYVTDFKSGLRLTEILDLQIP